MLALQVGHPDRVLCILMRQRKTWRAPFFAQEIHALLGMDPQATPALLWTTATRHRPTRSQRHEVCTDSTLCHNALVLRSCDALLRVIDSPVCNPAETPLILLTNCADRALWIASTESAAVGHCDPTTLGHDRM
jgi:hypothetical protein